MYLFVFCKLFRINLRFALPGRGMYALFLFKPDRMSVAWQDGNREEMCKNGMQ